MAFIFTAFCKNCLWLVQMRQHISSVSGGEQQIASKSQAMKTEVLMLFTRG